MSTTPIDNTPPTPPIISLDLDIYLSLACRGLDQIATVSLEFGEYIKSVDPSEQFCHVEFNTELSKNNLAQIYPISEWRNSALREAKKKIRAEEDRKRRFEVEHKIQEEKSKILRKRDMLAEALADAMKRFPVRPAGFDEKLLEYMVYRALNNEQPEAASKFGISLVSIAEFTSLPIDPEWRNKYYHAGSLPSKK